MSSLQEAFTGSKNKKAFIAFLTAGDPCMQKTIEYINTIAEAGADLIEIGIPFSDPTAEGEVIQNANVRALKNGMTTDKAFQIVEEVRKTCQIPLAFMTYANPVFHYGYEKFFKRCDELDVRGLILPDVPYEERGELYESADKYKVSVVSMIAPTSSQRIEMIAKEAKGFIYIVSSMGVTGVRTSINTDLEAIIESVRKVTDIPCAVGFGISTPEQAKRMAKISDGAIVGSAIVRIIEKYGEQAAEPLKEYIKNMKAGVERA